MLQQATAFEAEVKDKLEEAKETVSHKVAEVSQMAHSMAQFLTDAEVEQLLESSPWILVGTKQ